MRQQDIRWTYRQLAERVDALAAGLLALGLEPGDRVAIWAPNSAEWVVTQFATAKAGLILVNINPAYRLAELEYALNKVGCRALITATAFKTSDYIGMVRRAGAGACLGGPRQAPRAEIAEARNRDSDRRRARPGVLAFDDVLTVGGAAERTRLADLARSAAVRRPDQHPVHFAAPPARRKARR